MAAKVYAKILAALSDEDSRENILQFVLALVGGFLCLLAFIVAVFYFLISGIFGLITNQQLKENWDLIKNNVAIVFEGLEYTASDNVRQEVYDFMPDFSINLSKATVAEKYPNELLIYDTSELELANEKKAIIADALRNITTDEEYRDFLLKNELASDFSFSELRKDTKFLEDNGCNNVSSYQGKTIQLLNRLTAANMPNCKYETEYITVSGKSARRQTLVVTANDGTEQIVQYTAIGNVELYLPKFIAMYQARLISDTLDIDSDTINQGYEEASGVWEAENEDELQAQISNYGFNNSLLSVMQIADLKTILSNTLSNGGISAKTEYIDTGNGTMLQIILEAPDDKEWNKVFELDEQGEQIAEENQQIIEKILTDGGISEQDMWLSLDSFFQDALFIYFEGFFNLPVESDELRSGTNGLLSIFGDWQDVHRMGYNYTACFEQGMTLDIENAETPVCIDLLPGVGMECIEAAFVYDVWIADNHPTEQNNYLYNSDAITIAYVINTQTFNETYGFKFPVTDITGKTVTMFVEYSCLTGLAEFGFDEKYDTIFTHDVLEDIKNGDFEIGYCHSGSSKGSDTNNNSYSSYIHYYSDNTEKPHITVKMSFYDGAVYQQDTAEGVYNGISPGDNKWLGKLANPLYWFKSYRTELN